MALLIATHHAEYFWLHVFKYVYTKHITITTIVDTKQELVPFRIYNNICFAEFSRYVKISEILKLCNFFLFLFLIIYPILFKI